MFRRFRVWWSGQCVECDQPANSFYYPRCKKHGPPMFEQYFKEEREAEREEEISVMQEAIERAKGKSHS